MFYLFILESIGTSELLLIGLIALIVFGPRKLPELARTLGKAMNEFRRSTDDFKKTWAQEVDFESGSDETRIDSTINNQIETRQNSIQRDTDLVKDEIAAPEIKELSGADFRESLPQNVVEKSRETQPAPTNKQDWL